MNLEDIKKLESSFSPDSLKMKEVLSSVTFNARDDTMFFYQVGSTSFFLIALAFVALVLRGEILFTKPSLSSR
jgi:hypothetical protein